VIGASVFSLAHCRASTRRALCHSADVSDLKRARFARLVSRALADLPERYRSKMRNVQIVIEDLPDPERVPEGQELLGLYEGVPLTERHEEPWLPDRISIFRKPIEAMSSSPRVQAKIVRDTVIHEIAHHFGISDDRLDELGRS
jgi:predicted Zn-dependent protease with MMP-like domain